MLAQIKSILFPTDFSESSRHAQEYVNTLAKQHGAKIHVVHAENTAYMSYIGMYGEGVVIEPNLEKFRTEAKQGLQKVVDEAKTLGLEAEAHFVVGTPASEIIRLAEELDCDLVVAGTHGRSGFDRFVMGSTAEDIVRRSPVPVLTVKRPEHDAAGKGATSIQRIMCPVDFSDFSKQAATVAAEMCRGIDAELVLFHVLDERLDYALLLPAFTMVSEGAFRKTAKEILDGLAAGYDDLKVETAVAKGIPHKQIVEAVSGLNIDLIVMPTHGHGALLHTLLGSTAEKTVRLAPCPVLTFRPKESKKRES